MGKNVNRLGNVLAGRMQKTAGANIPTTLELGRINGDLSLSVDGLRGAISRGEYMVDIRLTAGDYKTSETTHTHSGGSHGGHESGSGTHTHDGGKHSHELPDVFRALKAGDRVLVAWVGHEPIVISIIVAS